MTQAPPSLGWRRPILPPLGEALVVAVVVAAVYYVASFADVLRVGALSDDGVYAVLGKALAEGHGYHSIHLIGSPVQVKYPPGFPFILSLLWRVGGSVEGVQHLVALLHPLVIGIVTGLLWYIGRVRFNIPRAVLVLLVILPFLLEAAVDYYTLVLSEPWFMLGWAGVLALWLRAADLPQGRARLLLLAAAALLVGVTTLVRTQAIVLVPALAVGLLVSRYSVTERVAVALLVLAPLGVWHVYHAGQIAAGPVSDLPDEGPYLDWLQVNARALGPALIASARSNVAVYITQIGDYLSPVSWIGRVETVLLVGGGLVGAGTMLRRAPVLAVSALGAFVTVLLWPFAQDRLLLPLLPFLGLAAGAALAPAAERVSLLPQRGVSLIAAVLVVSALLRQPDVRGEGVAALVEARNPAFFTPGGLLLLNSRYIAAASHWVRVNTSPSARVMIDKHAGVYLYSGRVTAPANPSESRLLPSVFSVPGRYLAARILADSLDYVIIGLRNPGIVADLETVRSRCPGVLTWGGTSPQDSKFIFRVHRDPPCLGGLVGE